MKDNISTLIIDYLKEYPAVSSTAIYEALRPDVSFATFKRILAKSVNDGLVSTEGRQKSVKYALSGDFGDSIHLFSGQSVQSIFTQRFLDPLDLALGISA